MDGLIGKNVEDAFGPVISPRVRRIAGSPAPEIAARLLPPPPPAPPGPGGGNPRLFPPAHPAPRAQGLATRRPCDGDY